MAARTAGANQDSFSDLPPHVLRLLNEYLEMPGLRLTVAQCVRLSGFDEASCIEALDCLVSAGFLHRTPSGLYLRLTDGAFPLTGFRMAKAELGPKRTTRRD